MKSNNLTILLVDDSPEDRMLISMAFKQFGWNCEIHSVICGEEAIAYLKGERDFSDRSLFPYPSIVISDLKMPNGDGFSVLQHLKTTPEWAIIPVLVLSASSDTDDIKRAYLLGASSYVVKPTDFSELRRILKLFYDFWSECQLPGVDSTGRRLDTESRGKLGQRFINQNDNQVSKLL